MLASLHSKASDLEEELKNVTNNLKSLEAQSEKVWKHLRSTFLHLYHIYFALCTRLDIASIPIPNNSIEYQV